MPKKPVLEAHKISKSFFYPIQVPIIKEIDLTLMQGETMAIMGRSGEGKSTLLHILGTLENACHGELRIAGQEVTPFNKTRIRSNHLGFVFQSFHLLEDCTALENILMPLRIARKDISRGSLAYQRAVYLLEQVELSDRANFHVKRLSGGEKQRVAIARAMASDPDILFADEPTGNLDNQTALIIQKLLFGFVHQHGKALVVVTHDSTLAQQCNKRYVLHAGKLIEE